MLETASSSFSSDFLGEQRAWWFVYYKHLITFRAAIEAAGLPLGRAIVVPRRVDVDLAIVRVAEQGHMADFRVVSNDSFGDDAKRISAIGTWQGWHADWFGRRVAKFTWGKWGPTERSLAIDWGCNAVRQANVPTRAPWPSCPEWQSGTWPKLIVVDGPDVASWPAGGLLAGDLITQVRSFYAARVPQEGVHLVVTPLDRNRTGSQIFELLRAAVPMGKDPAVCAIVTNREFLGTRTRDWTRASSAAFLAARAVRYTFFGGQFGTAPDGCFPALLRCSCVIHVCHSV
jgi:hypothetical protein